MTEPSAKQCCNWYSFCVIIWFWVAGKWRHSLYLQNGAQEFVAWPVSHFGRGACLPAPGQMDCSWEQGCAAQHSPLGKAVGSGLLGMYRQESMADSHHRDISKTHSVLHDRFSFYSDIDGLCAAWWFPDMRCEHGYHPAVPELVENVPPPYRKAERGRVSIQGYCDLTTYHF